MISRSENMARIRSRNTVPEQVLRRILRRAGLHPKPHPHLPGSPDVGFVRRRVALFLDGCFWHGCPQHYIAPKTRFEFWNRKLRQNADRDAAVDADLRAQGFRVVHLWQHELSEPDRVLERVTAALSRDTQKSPTFVQGRIWWNCQCGATDVQVTALSGPGSLKPAGRVRPEFAWLRCRLCGHEWQQAIPEKLK